MIRINTADRKKLKFGVAVSGVQTRDINGVLRLTYEGIEYGFKTEVVDDKLAVEIPPLDNIIKEELIDGAKLSGRLEVVAEDTFIIPWTDNFKVVKPIKVEATITEDEDIPEKEISVKATVTEEEDVKEGLKGAIARTAVKAAGAHIAKKVVQKKKKKNESKFSKALRGE
jgi:hypothetical protein